MRTEHKVIVLSILLGLLLWVADAALDCFIFYQGTFWGLLIYEIPPHEIYVRTLVLGCCVIFGVVISTVFGKFRRAEEKRRESEKQLRLAVKNSRDVLYKLNLRTGDFDYVSPSVVELGGYTPQEFILLGVKGLLRRIDPEDRDRFMMHFRNVLRLAVEDGLAPTIEYRWKHHDGEYRWFSDNRTVIRDGDGNPVSLIGSVRDVTVQKEAEKALGESEKKYRTLIETTQEGIGITSPGEELVFVNKAFASILGYEPSELVGRNLREFVPEERFEAFQMEIGKRQWGTSSHYETEMRHRDGSHRSLLVSASPLYDREGNYNGTLGMVTDITERKKAEEIQSALFRISQAVTSTANLEEFLKTTDEALGTLIDTANYYVALYDAEKEEYSFPYSVDQDEETDFSTRQLKRSLTDYVRRTGKPLLVDEETHRRLTEAGEADSVGRPSPIWLGTPLKTPRGVIGVAVVQHYSDPSAYSEADLDILSFVSGHIAVAIERKRAEEELRNSKEFAETIFNSVEDSISIIDTTDFRIVKANQSFLSKLNMEEKEVIGKYCYEVTHRRSKPCEPPDDPCPLAETLRTGCHSSTEHIHYGKDGREIYVEVSASPIINEKGEIPQVIHVARDITERKKAEEALRKAHDELEIRVQERTAELVRANEDLQAEIAERKRVEDALRLQSEIVANMAEGVQLTRTSDGVIVYTNPRFEDMFGYGHGELIGKNVSVLNAPSDKSPEDVAAEIIKDLSEEGVWYGEIQNIRKDGSRFWCRASVSTLRHGQHGEVWVAVHEDITARKRAEQELDKHRHHLEELVGERTAHLTRTNERLEQQIAQRKRAEEALRESEDKFRTIAVAAKDAIIMMDGEGKISYWNLAAQRIFGYTSEEAIGQELHRFLSPERYYQAYRKGFGAFTETGQGAAVGKTLELEAVRKDGTEFPMELSMSAIELKGEWHAVGLVRDTTERKKAEEALWESEEKYRLVSENIPVVVYSALPDEHSTTTLISGRILELTGYPHQEFVEDAELWTQIVHPHDREYVWKKIEEHREKMAPLDVEYRIITKSNTVKWVRDKATPMLDENGQIVRIDGFMEDITERRRAEEALRESEAKYRSLFENMLDGFAYCKMIVDENDKPIDFVYLEVNDAFERLMGLKGENVVGKKVTETIPGIRDSHPELFDIYGKVASTGEETRFDIHFQPLDIWLSISVYCPRKGYFVAVFDNITERKRAEEALRESEDKFRNLAEQSPNMIFINKRGRVVYANKKCEELMDYKREEFYSPDFEFLSLISPECVDLVKERFRRHMRGEDLAAYEYTLITKDGRRIDSMLTTKLIAYEGETAILGIVTDITERKKAEEAVRQSEEQLRALFHSAADIVFTKDQEGRYSRVNAACARLHGLSEEEFIGKTDFDLFPGEYVQHSRELDRHVIKEGRTFTGEYERPIGGKLRTFSVVKTPLHGPDGAIIGLCGIARDVTEQRSLEEQFRQAQKMESLGTLAGGVAHDFNNLLGGILGYVGLIKGDYSPGEKHYAMLELVERAGVRAAELTNQLLAFSRKGKYELRVVNLNNSVEDVLKLIGRTLDKSIEIATELQEKLPSVEGDPGQLEQTILNLCVNAAEAMPDGGKLQLETRVVALEEEFARKYLGSDPGDYVLLSVSDTGIGMDSETLSRMFEPFFTTKEVGKGTGLGLSTVYGIVKNHGGYVDVRSQPGKGTNFDIYLPVSKKQFTPPQPRAAELQTGHETILAVDDEEIIRSLLEETLKKLGYKVILANDGEEAVQIYEERKDEIDAVIIDMIMPHVGGRETFREIKRRNPDVRVLLASGYSQDGAAQRILDEGVRGFIQKPFELVELSQKLRQVLD